MNEVSVNMNYAPYDTYNNHNSSNESNDRSNEESNNNNVNNNNNNNNNSLNNLSECEFKEDLKLFHLTLSRGKIQSKFGVSFCPSLDLSMADDSSQQQQQQQQQQNLDSCHTSTFCHQEKNIHGGSINNNNSKDYLFVEEVLYLLQRGLIRCFAIMENHKIDNFDNNVNQKKERKELFHRDLLATFSDANSVLPSPTKLGMYNLLSLPIYLTYMHLRSQSYIVIRHGLLYDHNDEEEGEKAELKSSIIPSTLESLDNHFTLDESIKLSYENNSQKRLKNRRRRATRAISLPPELAPNIAYDVYLPNRAFTKSNPGPPDFVVAVVNFHDRLLFHDTNTLLQRANGIPLKIATVSDSGVVVMLGMSNEEVPSIR